MLSMIMTTILRLVLSLPTSDDDDSIAAAATTTTTSHLGRILFCHAVLLSLAIVGHDADLHLRYRRRCCRRRWSPLRLCNSELNSTVSSPSPHTHTHDLSLSLSLDRSITFGKFLPTNNRLICNNHWNRRQISLLPPSFCIKYWHRRQIMYCTTSQECNNNGSNITTIHYDTHRWRGWSYLPPNCAPLPPFILVNIVCMCAYADWAVSSIETSFNATINSEGYRTHPRGSEDATNSVGIIYCGKIQSTHQNRWDAICRACVDDLLLAGSSLATALCVYAAMSHRVILCVMTIATQQPTESRSIIAAQEVIIILLPSYSGCKYHFVSIHVPLHTHGRARTNIKYLSTPMQWWKKHPTHGSLLHRHHCQQQHHQTCRLLQPWIQYLPVRHVAVMTLRGSIGARPTW